MTDPHDLTRTRVELDPMAFAAAANARRTPGVHLTDVLKDMEIVLAGGKVATNGTFTRADLDRYALQGFLWEWAMTETLVDRIKETGGAVINRPTEYIRMPEIALAFDYQSAFYVDSSLPVELRVALTRGHVLVSPDGGCRYPSYTALLEAKWTTKSANMKPQTDKRIWFQQAPGYLLPVSLVLNQLVTDVEWHVQMACGTRWGEPPIYERWDKRYTPTEVMQVWAPIVPHVQWRIANGDPHGWGRYVR